MIRTPPGTITFTTDSGLIQWSSAGCYLLDQKRKIPICGQFDFTRIVTNSSDGMVSLEIRLRTHGKKAGILTIPKSDLLRPQDILMKMMNLGLDVQNKKLAALFVTDLYRLKSPKKKVTQVGIAGWHSMANGKLAYLAGGGLIITPKEDGDSGLVLDKNVKNIFSEKGSLDDWNKNVGKYCLGNPRLILAICAALSAPLLKWVKHDNFGIHFFGDTSLGKTNAYRVCASLSCLKPTLNSWNSTENAFIAIAKFHNDAVAIFDDIGSARPQEIERVAYHLMNGSDRDRAKGDGTLVESQTFRLVALSNGEFDYRTFFLKAKITIAEGQIVRFLSIPVTKENGGMFQNMHGYDDGAEFIKLLKENTSQYYGTVMPEFIKFLSYNQESISEKAKVMIVEYANKLKASLPVWYKVGGREGRVIQCFALMACAGELAIEDGILAWKKGDAFAGLCACFKAWEKHDRSNTPVTDEEVLADVRNVLNDNDQEFVHINERASYWEPSDVGYIKKVHGISAYLVFPEFFESVICGQFDKEKVIEVLMTSNLLILGDKNRHRLPVQMPKQTGSGKMNFYAIRLTITD